MSAISKKAKAIVNTILIVMAIIINAIEAAPWANFMSDICDSLESTVTEFVNKDKRVMLGRYRVSLIGEDCFALVSAGISIYENRVNKMINPREV